VGGAKVGGEGESVTKGGGDDDRDRPHAAITAGKNRIANKIFAACAINRLNLD